MNAASSRARPDAPRLPLIAGSRSPAGSRSVAESRPLAAGSRPAIAAWEALGTSAVLVAADGRALAQARTIVEGELQRIDWACSRFREDSELSRANAHAGRWVQVDELLVRALEVALRAARLTEGDVDPTVGVALELAGYDRDWKLLEPAPRGEPPAGESLGECPAPRVRAMARPGWQAIAIDRARGAICVPHGVKLDLGSTAKAWAADRASSAVHEATGAGVLVSLGGDVSARGEAPRGGWSVHVTDDHRAGTSAPGQRIAIYGGGLATSSVAARRWRHEGRTMHHIVDPRTGAPADGPWRTVSVAAIDCVDANIASTAALVRGRDAADWLTGLGVPARLVSHEGETLTVGAWPQDSREAASMKSVPVSLAQTGRAA